MHIILHPYLFTPNYFLYTFQILAKESDVCGWVSGLLKGIAIYLIPLPFLPPPLPPVYRLLHRTNDNHFSFHSLSIPSFLLFIYYYYFLVFFFSLPIRITPILYLNSHTNTHTNINSTNPNSMWVSMHKPDVQSLWDPSHHTIFIYIHHFLYLNLVWTVRVREK